MKRFLLWIVGVILGVVVLLGAVMAVSYSFTGEGSRPEAAAQVNGHSGQRTSDSGQRGDHNDQTRFLHSSAHSFIRVGTMF